MLEKMIQRAIAKIEDMLRNKTKSAESFGSAIGGSIVSGTVSQVYKTVKEKDVEKKQAVGLKHMKAIHAHETLGVNSSGHGHAMANLYQGDDGYFYKHTAQGWYVWNEYHHDWVQ